MQNKHLFVLIPISNKGEVGTMKRVEALKVKRFSLIIPRRCFFCGSFVLFVFHVCHAVFSVHCSLVVICWEMDDLLALLYVMFYCVFVTFLRGFPGQVWCLMIFAFFLTLIHRYE